MRIEAILTAFLLSAFFIPTAAADDMRGEACITTLPPVVCYHHTYVPSAGAECKAIYVGGSSASSSMYYIVQCEGDPNCARYHDSNVPTMEGRTCNHDGHMLTHLPDVPARVHSDPSRDIALVCALGASPGPNQGTGACYHHAYESDKNAHCVGVYANGLGPHSAPVVCHGDPQCRTYYDIVLAGTRLANGCR